MQEFKIGLDVKIYMLAWQRDTFSKRKEDVYYNTTNPSYNLMKVVLQNNYNK